MCKKNLTVVYIETLTKRVILFGFATKLKMEVPDVRVMSGTEKPRRYSIGKYRSDPDEIEKVTFRPSTELIPDEYEHDDNKQGLVLIFYSYSDTDNMKLMRQALSDQDYQVPDANVYKMTTKEFVMNTLQKIAKENHKDKTCLILIFMGNAERQDQILPDEEADKKNSIMIRDVWSHFTSNNCPSLKTKPKIFILQASRRIMSVQEDSRAFFSNPPKGAYDIPAEADILLVYKKVEKHSNRNDFIEQLCNNFHDDGLRDDMIGLVTNTDSDQADKRPILISTLTRKFYVRPSNQRGHHYDLHENHDEAIEILWNLHGKIKTIEEKQSAFRKRFEQSRAARKWPEASSSSAVASNVDDYVMDRQSPKGNLTAPKKHSATASSSSSVDSKVKGKKTIPKTKDRWRI